MKYRKARQLVYDSFIHDQYHSSRGDNYNFKSEWSTPKDVHPSNNLWKGSYGHWHKVKSDLSVHGATWYKCDMERYEKENGPKYRTQNANNIYEYDNPFMRKLDKYNEDGYEVTSKGYQKTDRGVTASIQRKRRTVW